MSNTNPKEDVLIPFKNWYQEFRSALLRQPNVPQGARVIEAARIVGEVNPYIKANLRMIELAETYAPAFQELITQTDQPLQAFPFMQLDFATQDYIALYVSLEDPAFAERHARRPGVVTPDIKERQKDCMDFFARTNQGK